MSADRTERYERVAHDRQTVIVIRRELRTAERRHIDHAEVRDEHGFQQLTAQVTFGRAPRHPVDEWKRQITYALCRRGVRHIAVLVQGLAHFTPEIVRRFPGEQS